MTVKGLVADPEAALRTIECAVDVLMVEMCETQDHARRLCRGMPPDQFSEEGTWVEPIRPPRIEISIETAHSLHLFFELIIDANDPFVVAEFYAAERVRR